MNELLFLGNLGTGEIVIIAIVVLLLFGGKKIPELMKGIGKGVKNFKDGVKRIGRRYQIRRYGKEVKEDATRRNVILGSPRRTSLDFISFYFSALCFCYSRVLGNAVAVR